MKITIFGGILIAALAFTSMAQAQTRTPGINRMQHREQRHITMDQRSGRISRREAFRLRMDERRLNENKRMAMADGRLTRFERRRLRNEARRINQHIHRDERYNRIG